MQLASVLGPGSLDRFWRRNMHAKGVLAGALKNNTFKKVRGAAQVRREVELHFGYNGGSSLTHRELCTSHGGQTAPRETQLRAISNPNTPDSWGVGSAFRRQRNLSSNHSVHSTQGTRVSKATVWTSRVYSWFQVWLDIRKAIIIILRINKLKKCIKIT